MSDESIQDLNQRGESQVFERKQSLKGSRREGLQSLCGMINADPAQGTVAFGIAPDGQVVGVEPGNLDKAQGSLSQMISSQFQPRLQCDIRVCELEGKRVVVVKAQRNRDVPYHEFDGRAFIREGTVTRQLSLAEKQSLQRRRNRDLHIGPWRCDRCGSWMDLLASVVRTDRGVYKSYACPCGGQFWPAT